jgi:hypothetical protein
MVMAAIAKVKMMVGLQSGKSSSWSNWTNHYHDARSVARLYSVKSIAAVNMLHLHLVSDEDGQLHWYVLSCRAHHLIDQ